MCRFHRSKGTNEIIKIAQQQSPEKELIVAGADVRGNKFSKKFSDLALEKNNVKFLGKLKTREKVSEFFNSIDCFLCPSVREGGCIALQEAIQHHKPLITANVPGCNILADIFNCPATDLNIFSSEVFKGRFYFDHLDIASWGASLQPFMTKSVEKEFTKILRKSMISFI